MTSLNQPQSTTTNKPKQTILDDYLRDFLIRTNVFVIPDLAVCFKFQIPSCTAAREFHLPYPNKPQPTQRTRTHLNSQHLSIASSNFFKRCCRLCRCELPCMLMLRTTCACLCCEYRCPVDCCRVNRTENFCRGPWAAPSRTSRHRWRHRPHRGSIFKHPLKQHQ
jgi:hypothetical protein